MQARRLHLKHRTHPHEHLGEFLLVGEQAASTFSPSFRERTPPKREIASIASNAALKVVVDDHGSQGATQEG